MTEHTYDRTWESEDELGNVIGSADLRFHFTYAPGFVGDRTDPPYGPEVVVFNVEQDIGYGYQPVTSYVRPDGSRWVDIWIEWAMDELYAEMMQAVADDLEPDADYAYEAARDRMLER